MVSRPLSTAGTDFSQRFVKLATSVKRGRRDTLRDMGMAAKKAQVQQIRVDTGDMRLSGVGRRGARVGARFDSESDSRVKVFATGPLHFVAHPMSPHRIPKQRRRGRRRYVVIPGVGVRAWAQHPGTRGKDTWNRGAKKARPDVTKAAESRLANVIKRGFG